MTNEEIKAKIRDEIAKTEELIKDYEDMASPVAPDNAIGRISRMNAINNKSISEAALRQAREKLQKLNYVLGKVGSDDFGKCHKCGKSIPLGRLLIKPESLYCVQCAR